MSPAAGDPVPAPPAADDGPGTAGPRPGDTRLRRWWRELQAFIGSVHITLRTVLVGVAMLTVVLAVVVYVTHLPQRIADTPQFRWEIVAAAAAMLPVLYLGNALSLAASARWRPPFARTVQLEAAEALTVLLTPANAGSATIRIRFLSRTGLDQPAAAAAAGIYSFLTTVVSAVAVTIAAAVATKNFDAHAIGDDLPSARWELYVVAGFVAVAVVLAVRAPATRRRILRWIAAAGRHLRTVAAHPLDAVAVVAGEVVTMAAMTACLALMLLAVGAPVHPAALLVLTQFSFAATTTVPIPGGLGIPDAILIAGLVSAGVPRHEAIVAALGYRMLSYWLPSLPGAGFLYNLYRHRLI